MIQDAYQSYQAIDLNSQTAQASPVQLILILMNGLQDELARARAHISAERFEQKANSINRCISILTGLSSALDMDSGAEVVAQMAEIYDYCSRRLHEAGVTMDNSLIDEVGGLLRTLQSGWEEKQVAVHA